MRWPPPGPYAEPPVRRPDGILDAMGPERAPRTPAQLINRLAPVARSYEWLWRRHALGALAGRPFPVAEELAELEAAVLLALPGGGPGSPGGTAERPLVVDVACSEGLYGRHLARHGSGVILVDHSVAFLRAARRRARAEGVADRIDAVRALAQRLPMHDAVADAVVMGGSLNEIGQMGPAVAELVRVLRPGGRLFCMSLVRAATPAGRAVQAALGPAGIRFPRRAETVALLGPSMRLVDERLDGVVLRLTAEKLLPPFR
jgi:SAM-dependent methyltransferase